MKNRIPLAILGFFALALLSGCATLLGSRSNTLVINATNDQNIQVFLDGNPIGNGPGKIKLPSREIQHGSMLELKSAQHEESYLLLRKPHAAYMIADALLGAIPLAIDFGTAQVYRPSPRKFEFNAGKETKQ